LSHPTLGGFGESLLSGLLPPERQRSTQWYAEEAEDQGKHPCAIFASRDKYGREHNADRHSDDSAEQRGEAAHGLTIGGFFETRRGNEAAPPPLPLSVLLGGFGAITA
jgi:hypothetical protein